MCRPLSWHEHSPARGGEASSTLALHILMAAVGGPKIHMVGAVYAVNDSHQCRDAEHAVAVGLEHELVSKGHCAIPQLAVGLLISVFGVKLHVRKMRK